LPLSLSLLSLQRYNYTRALRDCLLLLLLLASAATLKDEHSNPFKDVKCCSTESSSSVRASTQKTCKLIDDQLKLLQARIVDNQFTCCLLPFCSLDIWNDALQCASLTRTRFGTFTAWPSGAQLKDHFYYFVCRTGGKGNQVH